MAENYNAERTVTAIFKEEKQIQPMIQHLLDQGVSREHISVMGRNFQSDTRISGFITKRDVILGGLRTGAIFGSLFGSLLSLFTGIGVLFIPFVGTVVAAGPISAVLLGAATGAIAGSAGAGLASVLGTLGMPEDKAAVYQTRLQAGEFLVMAEVPANLAEDVQRIMQNAGGEEVHTVAGALPRPCTGGCNSPEDLSPEIRTHLSSEAQGVFVERYKAALNQGSDELKAEQVAWEAIHREFAEDEQGIWSKSKKVAV